MEEEIQSEPKELEEPKEEPKDNEGTAEDCFETIEEPQEKVVEEPRKRGRPRMTPEQKKEAKVARLKVVESKPKIVKKEQPKVIERVVREYVEVPVPATQQSPFESIGNVLRSRAVSEYERKKQQWASFQLI